MSRPTPRVLIFTVHKAASMFMHGITSQVCRRLEMPYYSTNNDALFPQITGGGWRSFIKQTGGVACFGQIRPGEADPCIPDNLDDFGIVLHLRDPRDAITSLFYSVAFSHPKKAGGFDPSDAQREQWQREGVDKYVLDHAGEIRERYQLLLDRVYGRPNVVYTNYEQLVADFGGWLEKFLKAFEQVPKAGRRQLGVFGKPLLERIRRDLTARHASALEPPSEENVKVHKRQVTPGDHQRKLKPETIGALDAEFAPILQKLGYPLQR